MRPRPRATPFPPLPHTVKNRMEPETPQRAMALLRILIASGEKTVEAFHASANAVDGEFVEELERIIQCSRDELTVLAKTQPTVD
jgi:hypothetical protein